MMATSYTCYLACINYKIYVVNKVDMHVSVNNIAIHIATIYHTGPTRTFPPTGNTGGNDDDGEGQSTAAVVAEVIGSIIGVLIVICCCCCCWYLICAGSS